MLHDVIVPLDGSPEALAAVGPAAAMAHYLGSEVTAVACFHDDDEKSQLASVVPEQLRSLGAMPHQVQLEPVEDSVGATIGRICAQHPGRLLVMTTRGRGRSASLLGSVAVDILEEASGPIMLVGPNYHPGRFRCHGPLLTAIPPGELTREGSFSRLILPTAQAFGLTFDFDLELDTVHEPYALAGLDPAASASLAELGHDLADDLSTLAEEMAGEVGAPVDHQVLRGASPGRALVKRAEATGAAAIAMVTGNPTGLTRLLLGSVTGHVVRHAPCPVIVLHPR
ncbi:MAG: universal stress protein [Actinomycetota bacterium]